MPKGLGWIELVGYVGSTLMFLTFFMKTMIPLRMTAIAANVVMIVYTGSKGVIPILVLQSCLLPLNVFRLVQMKRLIARVKAAARGDFKLDPLMPLMTHEHRRAGEVVFRAGDESNRLYYVQRGSIRLEELGKLVTAGEVVGEVGVLSPTNVRTATAICVEDSDLYSLSSDQVLQLFYTNPEFGFFLVRLVTRRLLANLNEAQFDAMATLPPPKRGT